MAETILFIDSNRPVNDDLYQLLKSKGYTVTVARSGKVALQQALSERPDLIIFDTTSPRLNSKRLSQTLYHKVDAPMIAIIGKRAAPLEYVDEHIANPLNPRKLLTLIRRILKVKQPWILRQGELTLDLKKRTVTRGNSRPKKMRPMEARLLKTFMRRPNEMITRAELMKLVWETDFTGDTRTLDVHIRWVREHIEENPSNPRLLKTMRGQGYLLEV
jgi:DNA-binding response OmpR family regulator